MRAGKKAMKTVSKRAGKGPHTRSKEVKKNIYSPDFESFFAAYPKHEAKKKAFAAWQKVNPQNGRFEAILRAIEKQKAHKERLKKSGAFCAEWPLPATWLNDRRWEDEVPEAKLEKRELAY
jgi:hypothetical protein